MSDGPPKPETDPALNFTPRAEIFSARQIKRATQRLAAQISAAVPEDFVLIALMDGALLFSADLLRALYALKRDPLFGTLRLSSYGKGQVSAGRAKITAPLNIEVTGKTVLLVDDILESGVSLAQAIDLVRTQGARRVVCCVLASKPYEGRAAQADFIGFDAPDIFLIGYGLDDQHRGRGAPFISASS